ncbi:MAG: NAD(P)/FAD-dependent oxidoreductase [Planctomycetota bacterium]
MADQGIYRLIVVGGGIAGSAAALRAAQYMLRTAWVFGDRGTAKASRAKYVYNIDNMIGVHPRIVLAQVYDTLKGEQFADARAALKAGHFRISTQDIIENAVERVDEGFGEVVDRIEERAVSARRDGEVFVVETLGGTEVRGEALLVATGAMDRQPSVKKTLKSGKVLDDIKWIYPYANQETLLYCIRCEGHLTRWTKVCLIGSSASTAELAMMLHERYGVSVTILTNGEPFAPNPERTRLLAAYGIGHETARIVDLIDGAPAPGAKKPKKGTALHGFVLEDGKRIEARFGMVSMGLHRVFNDLPRQLGAELADESSPDPQRHVYVDARGETSVKGLFCVGDMARRRDDTPMMKQIYTAQEFSVRAVDTHERRVRKARRSKLLAD